MFCVETLFTVTQVQNKHYSNEPCIVYRTQRRWGGVVESTQVT